MSEKLYLGILYPNSRKSKIKLKKKKKNFKGGQRVEGEDSPLKEKR